MVEREEINTKNSQLKWKQNEYFIIKKQIFETKNIYYFNLVYFFPLQLYFHSYLKRFFNDVGLQATSFRSVK